MDHTSVRLSPVSKETSVLELKHALPNIEQDSGNIVGFVFLEKATCVNESSSVLKVEHTSCISWVIVIMRLNTRQVAISYD